MSQSNIESEKTLIYDKLFAQCDVEKTGKVTISEANNLFRKSGLVIDKLNKIYKYCGANKYGFFGRSQFHNALEMISLAQAGVDVDENILKSKANYSLPRFDHEVNEAFKTVQKSHELPSSIPSTSSKHHMRTLSGNNISHHVPLTNWCSNSSSGNTLIEPEEGLATVPTITGAASTAEAYKQIPVATPEQLKSYTNFFQHNILHNNNDRKMAGTDVISLCQMHNLSSGRIERIMNLFNITPESELTFIEFCTALHLITHVEIGYEIPEILPENLLPAEFEQPDLSDDEVPADDGTTGSNFTDVAVNQAWMEDKGIVVLSLEYNRDIPELYVCVMRVICGSEQFTDVSVVILLRSIASVFDSKKVKLNYSLKNSRVESFDLDSSLLSGSLGLEFVFFGTNGNCSRPFGRLIIGPSQFASGARLAHWTEMCSGNKKVTMTHDIM